MITDDDGDDDNDDDLNYNLQNNINQISIAPYGRKALGSLLRVIAVTESRTKTFTECWGMNRNLKLFDLAKRNFLQTALIW